MNQTNAAFDRRATSLQNLDKVIVDFRVTPQEKARQATIDPMRGINQEESNARRLEDFRLKWLQYLANKAEGLDTTFPFPILYVSPANRRKTRRPWMIHRLIHDLRHMV